MRPPPFRYHARQEIALSSLTDIRGIGPALSHALAALGITTPDALAQAEPATLRQVRGISPGRAQAFIDAARALREASAPQAAPPAEPAEKPAKDTASKRRAKSPGKAVDTGKAAKARTSGKKKARAAEKKADGKKTEKKKAEKKKAGKKNGTKNAKAAEKKADKKKGKKSDKKKSGKSAKPANKKGGKKKSGNPGSKKKK